MKLSVSIVIPTYNRASYISSAIQSVLNQMQPEDELIVVDDGSNDDTMKILKKYGSKIIVVRGLHGGAGRARNIGINTAKNDLVAFLDSDDTWLPHKLQLQRAFMEAREEVLFCFTNFEVEQRDGTVIKKYLDRWYRNHATWDEAFDNKYMYSRVAPVPQGLSDFAVYEGNIYRKQLTGFYVLTDTLIVRRVKAGDALKYAEDLRTYEDLECFYRLSQRGQSAFLNVDTVRQLDHPHGRLSQLAHLEKIEARITLLRRIWGSDTEYLKYYSGDYKCELDRLLKQRAGILLSMGRNKMARMSLNEMDKSPCILKYLTFMPPFMTLVGIRLRRILLKR